MRFETLKWICCPAAGCAGPLAPQTSFPGLSDDAGELTEAVLLCGACGAEYPVVLGVALLECDIGSYLAAFWDDIQACGAEMPGAGISRRMLEYLGVASAFTSRSGPADPGDTDLRWSTSPYLQAHFNPGSLGEDLPPGWWRGAIDGHRRAGTDPYGYLMSAARELSGQSPEGLAIDVGTSVGRGAAELAAFYRYSLGVDRSFRAILSARRYLLRAPEPLADYRMESERGRWEIAQLPDPPPAENLDFVVASGAALPVATAGAACVAALNVICAAAEPQALLDDFSRALVSGGVLLVSSPYWSDDDEPAIGNPESLRRVLKPSFDLVAEDEMVPWVLRLATRRWNVYLCHCLVATSH